MVKAEGILRLLIVDDSLTDADGVINALRSAGHAIRATREQTISAVEQLLAGHTWDLLICRDTEESASAPELINLLQRLDKDVPCLVLLSDEANKQNLFNCGAKDIIMYGDIQRLQFAVERELANLFDRRLARRNQRALRESEKRSQALLESSRDAVAYMHEGMHIYVNSAYLSLFRYDEVEDIDGLPILDMISMDDHAKFKSIFRQFSERADAKPETVEVQCVKSDGTVFKADIEFSHARVEGEDCTQVVIRDDLDNITSDEQLQLLRDHDLLTGLYTRLRFMDELETVVTNTAEGGSDAELLYIVLDGFQEIKENISLGASDVVLKNIAEVLRKQRQEGEILGRYSDQVFTIIIPSDRENEVDERAEIYRKAIDGYITVVDGKDILLSCSIGISRISESVSTGDVVLDHADKACMEAQKENTNSIERYRPETDNQRLSEASSEKWQDRLDDALKNDGFCMFFQPIVSLHGEEQEIYEVLLRLKNNEEDGELGYLAADEFIHHATRLELMGEIDKWVIRHALEKLVSHRKTHPKTRFFIKLSAQTICTHEYVDWLCTSLNAHNLEGNALAFEISETAAIENLEQTKAIISQLKKVGCEFGLEHFGSGIDFSQSLTELDVDYLKINGRFVENMAKDAENQAAVKAIIEMTKQAGKRCIAEFVSDANSLALLWRLGVDYAQGYYIHEPSKDLNYNFEDDDL
ncbi:MAG: two-component system response regulator [Methylophaga sp.]|nr:MAG: two-component system response regulator [Methylophaga sp.]